MHGGQCQWVRLTHPLELAASRLISFEGPEIAYGEATLNAYPIIDHSCLSTGAQVWRLRCLYRARRRFDIPATFSVVPLFMFISAIHQIRGTKLSSVPAPPIAWGCHSTYRI